MNGFLNMLKPPGMTSAGLAGLCRRLTGEKRVGHAGTLDPEAAGVLPVMVGRATKLFDYLVEKEKTYVAEVAFGASTDTMDAEGRVLETGDRYPDEPTVREAARKLEGDIIQRPSMYSAIKKDGKPLYRLARAGAEVEVPERRVHVESLEVLRALPDHGWMIRVRCGRGTYIRSLCDDLGRLCGCPAHMRFLLRTATGVFDVETALTLEELGEMEKNGCLEKALIPMDRPLFHLPEARVCEKSTSRVLNGVPLGMEELESGSVDGLTRMYLKDRFLGLARREEDRIVFRVLFS